MESGLQQRIRSVDILRGIVMVIMALDHSRDLFHQGAMQFDPTDLSYTYPALFFTRWITHFCAPVFIFLAGTSIYLQLARGKTKQHVSLFLLTRGLWLIVLELTVVRFGWTFDFDYSTFVFGQVIWVLGWSMVIHAGLIFLPVRVVAFVGIVMIFGHNFFDFVKPDQLHAFGNLWIFLHVQSPINPFGGEWQFLIIYPLIPWLGVMSVGYAFGTFFHFEETKRRRIMFAVGILATAGFVLLRFINAYGDSSRWSPQADWQLTIISFFNTTKYPPSLLYLVMTLGPAIAILPYLEKWTGRIAGWFTTFGRVPLFYYILHIPLLHLLSILLAASRYGFSAVRTFGPGNVPADYGYSLGVTYLFWIGTVIVLYPLCVWYAEVKKKSTSKLLTYL